MFLCAYQSEYYAPQYKQLGLSILEALTKGGCPYSQALVTPEDILTTTMFSIYCIVTLCVSNPQPPPLQWRLIIGYVPYIEAIEVLISQIPTLPHYSLYVVGC